MDPTDIAAVATILRWKVRQHHATRSGTGFCSDVAECLGAWKARWEHGLSGFLWSWKHQCCSKVWVLPTSRNKLLSQFIGYCIHFKQFKTSSLKQLDVPSWILQDISEWMWRWIEQQSKGLLELVDLQLRIQTQLGELIVRATLQVNLRMYVHLALRYRNIIVIPYMIDMTVTTVMTFNHKYIDMWNVEMLLVRKIGLGWAEPSHS